MSRQTVLHPDNGIIFSKINELSSYEKTCRKLKCILPSEKSQYENAKYSMIQAYDTLERAKL